jgi:hypothetical protein
VIFASNKLGFENFELFIVDIDGRKEPVRVTYTEGFDGLPRAVAGRHPAGMDVQRSRSSIRATLTSPGSTFPA